MTFPRAVILLICAGILSVMQLSGHPGRAGG